MAEFDLPPPMSFHPPLEILCEDGPVIACNKPAGLLTEGAPAPVPTLVEQVKRYLKEKYQKPGNVYLGIPHRLDRPVSGVVLFARNSKAAARLAEQFHDRRVGKRYWAVVQGVLQPAEGEFTDWLLKIREESRSVIVPGPVDGAKQAALRYRTLSCAGGLSLLEIEPATGRMHQIRVQLASRGHPIVGDQKYGSTLRFADFTSGGAIREAIALHARRLTFLHPIRYDAMSVTAPLPPEWTSDAAVETLLKSGDLAG